MNILITNDDGVHAPGIIELAHAFATLGNVTVVGPESEQSGVSHALTFLQPMFVHELEFDHPNVRRFAVNGTPSDCTKLGILELCNERPDVVVSGINGGLNVGINCIYSGTLAGAREGAFFEIPSFAVSIEVVRKGVHNLAHIRRAAELSRELVVRLLESRFPPRTHFNVNFPIAALEGDVCERMVPMETRRFDYHFQTGVDPTGRPYYWTVHSGKNIDHSQLTDLTAVEQGMVSITPMNYDLTDHSQLVEDPSGDFTELETDHHSNRRNGSNGDGAVGKRAARTFEADSTFSGSTDPSDSADVVRENPEQDG